MSPTEPVRLSGVRGMIARRMTQSLATSAQLTFNANAQAAAALDGVRDCRERGDEVALEDVMAWHLVQLLADFPGFNALINDDQYVCAPQVNLGLAISAGEHLTVVTIRDAGALTLTELASARRGLTRKARAGQLTAADMRDSTITLSNLGRGRTESFTPILNPPQVALLGIAGLRQAPWVDPTGQLTVAPQVGLSLTVDHRVIDGAPAHEFLTQYCERIEAWSGND